MRKLYIIVLVIFSQCIFSQTDARIYEIIESVSTQRIESDIRTLPVLVLEIRLAIRYLIKEELVPLDVG